MTKAAYIALLLYVPVLIAFMLLTADSRLYDFLWFTTDKVVMCIVLFALREHEVRPNRRVFYGGMGLAMVAYIAYLCLDFAGVYRTNIMLAKGMTIIYIATIIYTLFSYDRKSKG